VRGPWRVHGDPDRSVVRIILHREGPVGGAEQALQLVVGLLAVPVRPPCLAQTVTEAFEG